MPFDSFARDFFDNWNDVGVVYTRNKYGRVSSPPGYGLKEKNDLSGFTESLFKGAKCSMSNDSKTFNPNSLFLICMDYVAKNVSMVESLEGFPGIIGEQLFHTVHENNGFYSNPRNLKLFSEAYGDLVLSHLSLTSKHILATNYLESLQLFVFVTELDVSHCRLGDSHDILSYMSHLQGLQKLSLKDNCLSDTGVKKLTLPQRLLKDGLGKLSVLDLSLNPKMSDNSIKYLVKINSLTALNLSGTGVTLTSGVPKLVDCTNLCLTPKVEIFKAENPFTVTKGWAVNLVNEWIKASIVKHHKEITKTNSDSAGGKRLNFYKSLTQSAVIKKPTEQRQSTVPSELPVIILSACGSKNNYKPQCSQSSAKQHFVQEKTSVRQVQPRKKLRLSEDCISSPNSFTVSADEALEANLVREYLNCDTNCKPVKKHISLLESLDCMS